MGNGKIAIVTGASSGIGMETAYALAGRGYRLALAARRADRLQEVAGQCRQRGSPEVLTVPTNVAVEEQVGALFDRTLEAFGRLDVLVNNAGYGLFQRVHETSTQEMRAIFETNFFGLFFGCRLAAPIMIRQKSGHIFNVSSIVGRRGTPFHGAYSATKFAVIGLTDTMRVELAPHNIRVTAVLPALTDTEFFDHSRRGQGAKQSFAKFNRMTPADVVARKIAAVVGRSRANLTFTLGGKFLVLMSALSPRLVDYGMRLYYEDLLKRLGIESRKS